MTRGESLLNVALAVLVVCAVTVTGLVVRRELTQAQPSPPHVVEVTAWRRWSDAGERMGPTNAPVTIVEFSDFQCPYCALLAKRLHAIRSEFPHDVAVVYRHYPLPIHQYAIPAARASECAASQGRFEAFHDALFDAQDSLGRVPWDHFAVAAGVPDLKRFRTCVATTDPVPALRRDTVAGHALGVKGTPTFLINGALFQGAPPFDTLHAYVARALHRRS